jgi:hypothetical protein
MRIEEFIGGNTRVILFARNLQLNPGEPVSAVVVRLIGSNNQIFNVAADDVRTVPNTDFMQVIFRLPDALQHRDIPDHTIKLATDFTDSHG